MEPIYTFIVPILGKYCSKAARGMIRFTTDAACGFMKCTLIYNCTLYSAPSTRVKRKFACDKPLHIITLVRG